MFNGALFVSKYLLFIGYIQNALTVDFHSIFTIVRSSSAPVTNDHRGSQSIKYYLIKNKLWKPASIRYHSSCQCLYENIYENLYENIENTRIDRVFARGDKFQNFMLDAIILLAEGTKTNGK